MASCNGFSISWCLFFSAFVFAHKVAGNVDADRLNSEVAKDASADFMVMDESQSPVVHLCGPNVNCAFFVYNHFNEVVSNYVPPCGHCIDGYECHLDVDDRSMCTFVFKCKQSSETEQPSTNDFRKKREAETVARRLTGGERTAKELSHCRPVKRQGLVADIHEL